MSTPATIKCVNCVFFKGVEMISLNQGLFKYLCFAYPKGIPEDIRCWDAENPSTKERPHTSIQDDQVGDFVFRLRDYKKEYSSNEIVNYQIYDVNGLVGEFITTFDLTKFRDFVDDLEGNEEVKDFVNKGNTLVIINDGLI